MRLSHVFCYLRKYMERLSQKVWFEVKSCVLLIEEKNWKSYLTVDDAKMVFCWIKDLVLLFLHLWRLFPLRREKIWIDRVSLIRLL